MEERQLAEKLIGYDTSNQDGVRLCAGFVKGWLEAREIPTSTLELRGLPILLAEGGTVRHDYGGDLLKNGAHASDSADSAARERKIVGLAGGEPSEIVPIIRGFLD